MSASLGWRMLRARDLSLRGTLARRKLVVDGSNGGQVIALISSAPEVADGGGSEQWGADQEKKERNQ